MALAAASSTQLGCGRDIDQVWDHLDRAPDAHELTCPYCRAARSDLAGLADATSRLRHDDQTDPDLQPSPQVLDRILDVARAEVRRGRRLPLDQPRSDGTSPNTISEQAVTAVVRRVGDRTRHIQIRRCAVVDATGGATVTPDLDPDVDVDAPSQQTPATRPGAVAVSVKVSVAHDLPIADASNRLREAIIEAVAQEVGMDVTGVDIDVEDVHDA